jgi:hypothetical protein
MDPANFGKGRGGNHDIGQGEMDSYDLANMMCFFCYKAEATRAYIFDFSIRRSGIGQIFPRTDIIFDFCDKREPILPPIHPNSASFLYRSNALFKST